jgi:hypothetical protein
MLVHVLLTHSALLDLICCNTKNTENLNHYPNDHIRHFRGWWHIFIYLKTLEKHFNAFK